MIQSIDVLKLCTIDISYCIFHIITNYHYFCRYFYFWKVFSITKLVKILVMRLVGKYTTKYVLDMQIRRRRLSNSFLLRLIINTALSIGTLHMLYFFLVTAFFQITTVVLCQLSYVPSRLFCSCTFPTTQIR